MENRSSRNSDLLIRALDNLSQEEFKRFKDKLSHFDFKGKGNIPRGWLENADTTDTKNLLMQFYGGDAAVDVTIEVFTQIDLRDSAAKLREEREKALGPQQTPETSANAYREKYREHIQNEYSSIKDLYPLLGENVMLNNRYTKLIIINGHRHKKEVEHEIRAVKRRHAGPTTKHANPITVGDLFESQGGQSPHIVVLQGAAGIGKTLTAQKIMLDWANGELYQSRFDYVFYINCRDSNFVSEQASVEDLILKNCPDQNVPTKEILMNPEKLLFIIDGFDELRFSFKQPTSNLCSDPCEKQPVEIILSSLFRKKMLLRSYLIITTRPAALEELGQCLKRESYAEILGFSENEREEYFHKYFRNEKQATKAFSFVKENDPLFTMCIVPLMCWMICKVLKQQMEEGKDLAQISNTITGVYMNYLFSLIKHDSNTSEQPVQRNLKGLCSLAADGIWRGKVLFEEEDVKKYGLDKPDSLFLNENTFHKAPGTECVYSFIHLSFQEFFAALFYVLEKEETVENSETAIQPVEKLFEKCEEPRNHLMLTVRFLFGLLNKKRMEEMEKKLSCKISPQIKNNLLTWVKEKLSLALINYKFSYDATIFYFEYFHCFYEIQETEFVQSAMNHFTELNLSDHTFTKMDQIVLQFCIKNCCNLESVDLDTCTFLTEDLNEDSPGPSKRPCGADEHEPLSSPIYPLCEALADPNCKIKKLRLWECELTDAACGDLANVLRTSQSLTELELNGNNMDDAGVQLLCEGLKHPNCKLQRLNLKSCDLTDADCRDLADVLGTSQSLTELDLEQNDLGDAGVQLLCEGLKHPNCKLQRLNLKDCCVRDAACGDLAAVLRTSQSLTELNLHHNYFLDDARVRLLCEGLKHPNCRLQRLGLELCRVTAAGCGDLAAVLRTSQSLTELDLGCNQLGEAGVRLLCEGLKHPNCKLQKLGLERCRVRDAAWGDLAAVLTTSQSLTELDLWANQLGEAGVRLLCEGLKHPNCKLQKLKLEWCRLTAAAWGDLAAVLTTSQSLTELHLWANQLGDDGVRLLCEGLKDPNCKLQKLRLKECGVTAAACGDLAAVLRTSQSLTELDLWGNELGEAGVRLLCEGLKHPNCKLQKLNLDQRYFPEEMWAELDAVKDTKPDLVIETQYSW